MSLQSPSASSFFPSLTTSCMIPSMTQSLIVSFYSSGTKRTTIIIIHHTTVRVEPGSMTAIQGGGQRPSISPPTPIIDSSAMTQTPLMGGLLSPVTLPATRRPLLVPHKATGGAATQTRTTNVLPIPQIQRRKMWAEALQPLDWPWRPHLPSTAKWTVAEDRSNIIWPHVLTSSHNSVFCFMFVVWRNAFDKNTRYVIIPQNITFSALSEVVGFFFIFVLLDKMPVKMKYFALQMEFSFIPVSCPCGCYCSGNLRKLCLGWNIVAAKTFVFHMIFNGNYLSDSQCLSQLEYRFNYSLCQCVYFKVLYWYNGVYRV